MNKITAAFQQGKAFIPFLTGGDPDIETTEQLVRAIAREAEGFIYCVSSLGVTGVRSQISSDIGEIIELARQESGVPCAIGFGISTPQQARDMAKLSDGVIVGSAIVKLIAQHGRDSVPVVAQYVREMKAAIADL